MNNQLKKLIDRVEQLHLIPIPKHQKMPVIKGWNALRLFAEDCVKYHPNSNYGVMPCFSNLFILDIDIKNGINGKESLIQLIGEEAFELISNTFTVQTPSGGYHLYFKGQCGNPKSKDLEGIDLRSTSGQVVAPGSVIGEKEYLVIRDLPLLEVEAKDIKPIIEEIAPPSSSRVALKRPTTKPSVDGALKSFIEAKDGERNNKFNTLAFLVSKYAKENAHEVDSSILLKLATDKGLTQGEIDKTLFSAFEAAEEKAIGFDWLNPEETKDLIVARFLKQLWVGRYMIVDHKPYYYEAGRWVEDIYDSVFYDSMKPLYKYLRNKRNALCDELKGKESEELKLQIKRFSSLMYYTTSVRGNDLTLRAFKHNFKELKYRQDVFQDEKDLEYLSLNNGVLHLPTLELLEHSPRFKNRVKLKANYLGKGIKNKWLNDTLDFHFQDDEHTKENFRVILCYLLTPAIHWEKFFCFVGNGGEGKSFIIERMLSAITIDNTGFSSIRRSLPHSLLQKTKFSNVDYELIELRDAHIAHVEEFPEAKHLDLAMLKNLTSATWIEARGAYDKIRTRYLNKFKIVITSNTVPTGFESTEGFERRMEIIRFNNNFIKAVNDPTNPLSQYKGFEFSDKDRDEIFTELINLAPSTVYKKRYKYTPSAASLDELDENTEEQNPYLEYIKDYLTVDENEFVPSAVLRKNFVEYQKTNPNFGTPRGLIVYLRAKNIGRYIPHYRLKEGRTRGFKGLQIKPWL